MKLLWAVWTRIENTLYSLDFLNYGIKIVSNLPCIELFFFFDTSYCLYPFYSFLDTLF